MKVGTLEIEMLANMARLQKDMNDAKRIVGDAAQSIERYAALAKAALAGISVAGLTALAKSAIDAMDAIRDLSLATGISVEQLAGLGVAAKQTGGDLNSIAGAMNKLSVNIGKDGERFRALGITAKEPLEAFKQLSDVFVNLKDPQQRAAVMAEALGKSWMGAAPLLAEGGAKIGELVEVGTRLSGVTKQMTDEADAFNDKLVLLGGTGGFATRMIGPLLPLLNALADEMLKAQDKSTSLGQSFSPLLEIGKAIAVLFGNVAFVFRGVGTEIGGMAAQIAAFASGNIKGGLAIGRAMKEDAEKARASFDGWEKSIMSIGAASTAAIAPVKGLSQEQQRASQAAAAAAATFLGAQKAGTDEITKLLAKINGKESGLDPSFYDDLQKLFGAYKGGKLTLEQYRDVVEKLTNQQPFVKAGLEAEAKALEHLNKLRAEAQQQEVDAIDARNSMIDGMTGGNAMLQAEIAEMLGAKNAQRELTLAREEALAIRLALTDEDEASVIALYAQKRALLEQKDAVQQSRSAFSSWYDIIDGGFKAALQGAKSFGDYLKNGLKNALYQLIARPFVIQLAATLTGSSASTVASALGGNGGGIGSLLGGLGSLSGIGGSLAGGLTSIGLGGAGQFVGGLTGAISGPGLTGAAGAGSSAAGMLSAAGPYIAAALAAYQLFQTFRDKGENPRYRLGFGSAAQGYASDSIFGMQGFQYAQGNDAANQGFRNFQRGLGGLDTQIGGLLTPAQIAAAAGRLNGVTGREFSFPKGDPTASEQLSKEFLQIKYSAVFADLNSGISDAIKNFAGNSEELIKYIGEQVTAYQQLQTMLKEIDNTIAGLSNNGVEALTRTLQSLADNVTTAQEALADARELNDPTKEVAAQKALMDAILNRYNTESKLIQDLADQLASIQSGAFDFGQQMAQRISSVGGDLMRFQDVPGMSKIGRLVNSQTQSQLGRIATLQGQIGGESDPSRRLGLINSALSVVDQYVSTGQAEIRARYEALSRGQQDSVRLQQDALAKRIQGLQTELDLVSQMQGIADSARAAIKAISFSGQNPGSAFARYGMQGDDIAALQNTFRNTTGNQRAGAANSLIQAIQGRLASAGDLYQRPSDEYLKAYNEAMVALSEVQGAAQSDAERALELQSSIEALTLESNGLTQNLIDYTELMNDALDQFNAQALGFYTDLGQQGTDTYALLEATGQAQLDVATRGLTVAEAQRGLLTEIRNLLSSINDGSGTATIGNGRKPAIDGGTLILRIDGRDIEGVIVDTVRSNRRVINEALSQT
jgi:hypothetical protein